MKNKILAITIMLVCSLFIGCSKPTFDARSKETFRESTEKLKKSLPVEKHDLFEARVLFFLEKQPKNFKDHLHGKTAEEILDYSERIIDLKAFADTAMMYLLEQGAKSVTADKLNKKILSALKFSDQYSRLSVGLGDAEIAYTDSATGVRYSLAYDFSLNTN